MERIKNEVNYLNDDPDFIKYMSEEDEARLLKNTLKEDAYQTGIHEGIEKGIEKGKLITAKELLKNNIPIDIIVKSTGLTEEEINMIIIKSPMITLYSNNLGYIYYLFKSKRYYGYTILDDNKINTYLLNRRLKSNIISNNYVVEKMINYYKVNNYNKETFDDLERDFKLKNYYFKKK